MLEKGILFSVVNFWSIGFITSLLVTVIFLGLFLLDQSKIKKVSRGDKENEEEYESLAKKKVFYKWAYSLAGMLAAFFLIKLAFGN